MVEDSECKLDAQDAAHGFIDDALLDFSVADLCGQRGGVQPALHIHIDAGFDGLASSGRSIRDNRMLDQLRYRSPVGDD